VRVTRHQAKQVHPVPDRMIEPRGPFPRELFDEPTIVYDTPAFNEDGLDFPLGATVQNNYSPPKYLRCGVCLSRVLETDTDKHICEE